MRRLEITAEQRLAGLWLLSDGYWPYTWWAEGLSWDDSSQVVDGHSAVEGQGFRQVIMTLADAGLERDGVLKLSRDTVISIQFLDFPVLVFFYVLSYLQIWGWVKPVPLQVIKNQKGGRFSKGNAGMLFQNVRRADFGLANTDVLHKEEAQHIKCNWRQGLWGRKKTSECIDNPECDKAFTGKLGSQEGASLNPGSATD